jgi:hypothetical protein
MNSSLKRRQTKAARRAYCGGTASVEAVIAIPTLVIILASVFYISRTLTKTHHAEELARSCAWRYSANGCSKIPSGCETLSPKDSNYIISVGTSKNSTSLVGRITSGGAKINLDLETAYADREKNLSSAVAGLVRKIFGSYIMDVMQTDAASSVDYQVSRKGLMDALDALTARYQLPCNLKEKTVTDVATDAWNHAIELAK